MDDQPSFVSYVLVICMNAPPPPPLPINGGEMRGIPGDIGGNSMSIPGWVTFRDFP